MAEPDFTGLTGNLGLGDTARGVTEGIARPNGGGFFTFGAKSLTSTVGVLGFFGNQTNFAPMASGGQVTGALMRNGGGGDNDYSVGLFQSLQGANTTDLGYILGLTEDEEPAHLILKKGRFSDGLASNDSGILRTSTSAYTKQVWYHFRLDIIVQPSGDVRLQMSENTDLTTNPVTAPVWTAIDGMADFIDDALGVASGSVPYIGGRAGFAFVFGAVNRSAFVDHLTITRQL